MSHIPLPSEQLHEMIHKAAGEDLTDEDVRMLEWLAASLQYLCDSMEALLDLLADDTSRALPFSTGPAARGRPPSTPPPASPSGRAVRPAGSGGSSGRLRPSTRSTARAPSLHEERFSRQSATPLHFASYLDAARPHMGCIRRIWVNSRLLGRVVRPHEKR